MKLFLDCYACVLRQALTAARLSKLGDEDSRLVMNHAMMHLLDDSGGESPQTVIAAVYDFIRGRFSKSGNAVFDPYAELKKDSTTLALQHFDYLENLVLQAESPLETAIKNAAAGNIIDFGALDYNTVDIEKEIKGIPSLEFSIYDFSALSKRLQKSRHLLYIADNAGEIVFDRVLIRQIKREITGINIFVATRGMPILNDITIDDAIEAGVNQDAVVFSSGSPYPGTVLRETTVEFQDHFRKADVIIAKGQGNYEGLWEIEDERLFFILRVKCDRIAESIGTVTGALVLRQKTQNSRAGNQHVQTGKSTAPSDWR